MAQVQSAVSDLLEAFRAGEGVDLVRESVRIVLQELIDTEATAVIGADRYERTPDRVTERNGFPNEASVIRLVGMILADTNDEWITDERRYLSEGSMAPLYPDRDNGPVPALPGGTV